MASHHRPHLPRRNSAHIKRRLLAHEARRRRKAMSRRRIILLSIAGTIGLLVLMTAWVGVRALIARSALESARAQLVEFRDAVGTPGNSTADLYGSLAGNTNTAASFSSDPIWRLAELLPGLGSNLTGFREIAGSINDLVNNGVGPVAMAANGLSTESLKPVNGAIDISPLVELTPAVVALDDAVLTASARVAAIDTSQTVAEVDDAVIEVQDLLAKAAPLTAEFRKVVPLLGPALGAQEARDYILMFQNNAEERASGGNPASLALLTIDNGTIALGRQANSRDFDRPYAEPVLELPQEVLDIYGTNMATWVTDTTFSPDFPTSAKLVQRMWEIEFDQVVDGVISFDPVALQYLLQATGPIELANDFELTSENAVDYLLSGVYAQYADVGNSRAQEEQHSIVFDSASSGIFNALSSGQGDAATYIEVMEPIIEEGRLKMWSALETEEAALLEAPVGGVLPVDNTKETRIGVYFNDRGTSKMSYYMDAEVGVDVDTCDPDAPAQFVTEVKVISRAPEDAWFTLPNYVLPDVQDLTEGYTRIDAIVYGPVGAEFVSADLRKEPILERRVGNIGGRPVVLLRMEVPPSSSDTMTVVFRGGDDLSEDVTVSTNPKINEVPVEITQATCG